MDRAGASLRRPVQDPHLGEIIIELPDGVGILGPDIRLRGLRLIADLALDRQLSRLHVRPESGKTGVSHEIKDGLAAGRSVCALRLTGRILRGYSRILFGDLFLCIAGLLLLRAAALDHKRQAYRRNNH